MIVVSAKSSQRDQEYALRLGANQFLAKPYRIDQLLKTIESFTAKPGFQVQPKRLPLNEIAAILAAEEQARKDKEAAQERRRQYNAIATWPTKKKNNPPSQDFCSFFCCERSSRSRRSPGRLRCASSRSRFSSILRRRAISWSW